MRDVNQITGAIVDAAYHIHTRLGPGLLESVYEGILADRLVRQGYAVERQKPVTFEFDGVLYENGFKVDLLVENQVIVELKSAERIIPVNVKQILTYLRLLNLPVGLLINFGAARMQEGLQRVTNFHASIQ